MSKPYTSGISDEGAPRWLATAVMLTLAVAVEPGVMRFCPSDQLEYTATSPGRRSILSTSP